MALNNDLLKGAIALILDTYQIKCDHQNNEKFAQAIIISSNEVRSPIALILDNCKIKQEGLHKNTKQ